MLGVDPERIADSSRGLSEATPPESVESRYLIPTGSQQLWHAAFAAIPSRSNRVRFDRTGGVPCVYYFVILPEFVKTWIREPPWPRLATGAGELWLQ